jgi:hypothetical protein
MIDADPVSDRAQPTVEAVSASKTAGSFPRPGEGFLHDLFTEVGVTNLGCDMAQEPATVAPVELCKRRGDVRTIAFEQFEQGLVGSPPLCRGEVRDARHHGGRDCHALTSRPGLSVCVGTGVASSSSFEIPPGRRLRLRAGRVYSLAVSEEFLVLLGLRLKGIASAQAIEETWAVGHAADHLSRLRREGCCELKETPRGFAYMLTAAGRERLAELLVELRAQLPPDSVSGLDQLYRRFGPLNAEFKELCARWQLRGPSLNDHRDRDHDEQCICSLEDLHARFLPIAIRVGQTVPHLSSYPDRFRSALRRLLDDGDFEYFTKPFIDSYHTVWFEFHEDLIAMLGRERQADDA